MTTSPRREVHEVVKRAIGLAFGLDHDIDPLIRDSDFADYQANAALSLARELKRPPRDIAESIRAAVETTAFAECAVSGPGYLNITLADEWLSGQVLALTSPVAKSGGKVTVVDYSSPNIAKRMHVGHLRTTVVGDAIARIAQFEGERVIRQNHIGDWGTPFGMIIEKYLEIVEENAGESPSPEQLTGLYKQARAEFDQSAEFARRSRERVVALQSSDKQTLAIWRELVAQSVEYFQDIYGHLGVDLTPADVAGESSYQEQLEGVCAELEGLGLARMSEGALCVFPAGFTGRDGGPAPLIIRKSDGGFGYATTDLAAIRHRVKTLCASRILYVVGAPQAVHFQMVFATAREAGWLGPNVEVEHVQIGNVLGDDGKMLRTRQGESVALSDALRDAERLAFDQLAERNPAEDQDVLSAPARAIGVGALKFADLVTHHATEYVFDLARMLRVQGRTGPYTQYAAVRLRSLLGKAADENAPSDVRAPQSLTPGERALALRVLEFEEALHSAHSTNAPDVLANYLADLAQAFNGFYDKNPVSGETDLERRAFRIALCQRTLVRLETASALLGVQIPERM